MTPVNPDTLQALTAGISSEVASYVFYLEASKKPEAADFKEILEELALEEKKHFHILERQHNSLIKSEQWISLADVLKEKGLPEINEEMAEVHKDLIDQVRSADSARAVLDIAYRLEEEARDLFSEQIDRTDSEEGKKMFRELARFEAGHMKTIDQMRQKYS